MLAGIGVVILTFKTNTSSLGYDFWFRRWWIFFQANGGNIIETIKWSIKFATFWCYYDYLGFFNIILAMWTNVPFLSKLRTSSLGALVVIVGIFKWSFISTGSSLAISSEHLVSLPIPETVQDFKNIVLLPDFSAFLNYKVWIVGATIAIVASIETLLCIEAADRMDAQKRLTDTNIELKAQGIGNCCEFSNWRFYL